MADTENEHPEIVEENGSFKVITRKSGEIEITGGLPDDFEPAKGFDAEDPEAWNALMNSADAIKRKSSMDVLKALGYEPTKYIHWKKDERALVLAAHARIDAAEPEPKEEKKAAKTSAKSSAKASAKSSAKAESAPAASVDLSEVTNKLDALAEEVAGLSTMLTDAHFLIRALVASNPDVSDMLEDLTDGLHGVLAVDPGNDEG